jgi:FAD/FMN-containing dehydrogenase
MRLKWFTEKYVEPRVESCSINRNQAQGSGEACLVSRNEPMHDSVPYLKNALKNDTDILHEYFIPRDQFIPFVNGMRDILENNNTTLLNASVRVVHKEDTALNYAPKDAFAIVLYINQTTDAEGNTRMKKVTSELIDLTAKVGGRFFLPYQLHYTPEQLLTSYPELPAFAAMKKKYDPELRLTNTWYNTYVKGI